MLLLVDHLSTNGNYDDTNIMMNNNIINYYTKAEIFFEINFTTFNALFIPVQIQI